MRGLSRPYRILILSLLLAAMAIPVAVAQTLPADAKQTCTVTPAQFNGWFASGSVSLNGIVNPANSVTFNPSSNCAFYQWSHQMFLWLTSPSPSRYGPGAHVFDSPVFYDISIETNNQRHLIPHIPNFVHNLALRTAQPGPHGLPVIFDKKGKMFEFMPAEVAPSGRPLVLNKAGQKVEASKAAVANGKLVLSDQAGKPIAQPRAILRPELVKAAVLQKLVINNRPIFLDVNGIVIDVETGQAGGSPVLMAQNGSLVYYVSMVNDVWAYLLTGTKTGGITPAPTQFPTTQSQLNQVVAYAQSKGKTFPDPNALAIELKTAWVEASSLPNNAAGYVTMNAIIPTFNTSNPKQWTPSVSKNAKLALVGMHVVGSAHNHPEMIWSTFEHFGNAPNAQYSYVNASSQTKTVPQSTAGSWLFCKAGSAGPFNAAHMDSATPPNINADGSFNISPSDTIRWKAFGGASNVTPNPLDASTAASNTEVISINNSVLGKMASGDIRANYYMSGSTWTNNGAAPTTPFNNGSGNQIGTSQLANTSMETYQQGSDPTWSSGENCFACHGPTNTVTISHMWTPTQPLGK
jgi:hypothetical protein